MYKNNSIFVLLIILLMSVTHYSSFSEETEIEKVKSLLPELLGANNVGKEFWLTIPPCYEESAGYNFIKFFITSAYETNVNISIAEKSFNVKRTTIANGVIEVNITPAQGQPYTKATQSEEVPEEVFEGTGIHIEAEHPIVVYCVVRYQATSDGFLALPVSSLGIEYIASPYSTDPMFKAVWNIFLPSLCGIVAAYDDTEVRFTLGGNEYNKTAGGLLPGESTTVTMNKGDVFMVSSKGDYGDLSGSHIVATKPVAVVSGVQCTNIPIGNQWCDYTVEMEIPTFTWGTHYHVPKVPNRKFAPLVRIFAKEPNTTVYIDENQIGFLESAGGILNKGFIETRLSPDYNNPRSGVIHADKPINVTLYNTGVQEDGTPHPNSDPFTMSITPISQYQKEILFATPGLNGSGFAENYLNVVFETNSYGEIPEDLFFAKQENGAYDWNKVSDIYVGDIELLEYDIQDTKYAVITLELSGEGVYRMKADRPFAAYSFGYASYDSYGYPASAALKDSEFKDQIPPVPLFDVDCAGNVSGNGPNNMAIIDDKYNPDWHSAKLSLINLDVASKNYEINIEDFVAGEDEKAYWELKRKDIYQDAVAYVTFCDRNGNDTTIAISYEAPRIDIRSSDSPFKDVEVGDIKTETFTIQNLSEKNDLEIANIYLSKNSDPFKLDLGTISLPITLTPQSEITTEVILEATRAGKFSDQIIVENSCGVQKEFQINAEVTEPTSINGESNVYIFPELSPNPINSNMVNIQFSIAITDWTELTIYDAMGKIAGQPYSGILSAGQHEIPYSVESLHSGIYYIVLKSGDYSQERKFVVVK
jgi:hypothetical protein